MHYKLDLGIDHVLIDEAQDTSPKQWEIVRRLTAEFFAGLGAREVTRSIFAVGDEKQSIFSFQGAEPGAVRAERGGTTRTSSRRPDCDFADVKFKALVPLGAARAGGGRRGVPRASPRIRRPDRGDGRDRA